MKSDVVKARAVRVRYQAAMELVGFVTIDARWNLLFGVICPSPELEEISERKAEEELAYWADRRARKASVAA